MQLDIEQYRQALDTLYDCVYLMDNNKKIIYWSSGAEQHTGYGKAEMLGQYCWDNLKHRDSQGNELCGTACPVSETFTDNRLREVEVFINHKHGDRVPAFLRIAPFSDGNDQAIIAVEMLTEESPKFTLRRKLIEMQRLALLDPLLGIGNRRYVEISLNNRLEEMKRYGWPFGILFVDLDDFKKINDRYGHETGDRVLTLVTKALSTSFRSFDFLGRWGGEELIVILLNVNRDQLYQIANRFRLLVAKNPLKKEHDDIYITVSIGATIARQEDTLKTLIQRADSLMYQSKSAGKNCITVDDS